MLHTTDRMAQSAGVVALMVLLIVLDPSHSYTRLHHGHRFGMPNGMGVSNRETSRVNNVCSTNHPSTRLHMSTPTEKEENDLNYYEILGASPDASRGELKKKYIALARVSHPDAQIGGNGNDDVDFQNVTEAWRTLGNPKSRKRYDRQLKAKAWGEAAQRLTNERLEQVAPLASSFIDNLAVPFLRKTGKTVRKAVKTGKAVADAVNAVTADETVASFNGAVEETAEPTKVEEDVTIQIEKNVTNASTTDNSIIEPVEASSDTLEATKSEPVPNGATSTAPIIPDRSENITSVSEELTLGEKVDELDGETPDELLDATPQELEEQVKTQAEKAKKISEEYDSIKEKRLFASLQSPESSLTSYEAEEVLEKLNEQDDFVSPATKQTRIKKDIISLRNAEEQFTEKLESYTEIDREWNSWLDKSESAKKTLRENKKKEFEARKALTTAEEMVSKANTDVLEVSNKLRGVEQEVRRSAQEMDRVSTTLSKRQERVQNALRRKTELMKGGISLEYVTEQEVRLLRKRETQLLGESKQIATMVAKLQSRADALKKRAEALEKLKSS